MGTELQAYFAWHMSRNSGSSYSQRLSPRERSGIERADMLPLWSMDMAVSRDSIA
jgi:hypothetical protein